MKTQNLVKELKRFGIRAANYVRPPVGADVFALTILPRHKEGVVTVNQGQAKVQVFGNKKIRQAAVTVNEPPRVVTRDVTDFPIRSKRITMGRARSILKSNFPVIVPHKSKWEVSNIKITRVPGNPPLDSFWKITGTVTARVGKKTVNHFLIGIDETRNFVAPLPRKATSVQMAHRMLKPVKEMRRQANRQGEFFFVPARRAEIKLLEKIATETPNRMKEMPLEKGKTHIAKTAIVILGPKARPKKGKRGKIRRGKRSQTTFARGYIVDTRKGHHKSIFLPKWNKVVRNKEVEIKVSPQQRKAARRRRQTWD